MLPWITLFFKIINDKIQWYVNSLTNRWNKTNIIKLNVTNYINNRIVTLFEQLLCWIIRLNTHTLYFTHTHSNSKNDKRQRQHFPIKRRKTQFLVCSFDRVLHKFIRLQNTQTWLVEGFFVIMILISILKRNYILNIESFFSLAY